MNLNNIYKKSLIFFFIISTIVILLNSLAQLYEDRVKIFNKLRLAYKLQISANPLDRSQRQIPPKNYQDFKTYGNEDKLGAWTAPFDWNVTAVHSVLLPDETVMTFGSYAIEEKEKNKDVRENKKLVLTDKFELDRDKGDYQWEKHNVQGGVDFDIWDPKKGFGDDSHTLIKKPLVLDAFCSVIRVFDLENVFILGGNKEPKETGPDTQAATTFYKIKSKTFIKGNNLHYNRWYGSIVRTPDDKFVMMGGRGKETRGYSIVPEILQKDNSGTYNWRILNDAKSLDMFADLDSKEWNYPKAYLASDGNIFGISYNKMWVMNTNENFRLEKVGEIPLVSGSIKKTLEHDNPNDEKEVVQKLRLLTIGSGVGSTASSVMIDKDKILLIGGHQKGVGFSPSNHVNLIDVSDTKRPLVSKMMSMNYARSNANAVVLPTGEVFVNGGHSFNDREFSVLIPEIYNPEENSWAELAGGTFRRNYHATSLLLPNGTILVAGGDVWNAEIFYPPYLFEKDWNGNVNFAKRPTIEYITKTINNRSQVKLVLGNTDDISKISLISTGSTTHAQASELKYLSIGFKKIDDKEILLDIPESKNILQNGTYLIFALNSSNVPSEGEIIYLN
jgi:hypothetical protein